MKKEFFGFYAPSETEIDKAWRDGIFVFDANALLNLYRYTDSTRNDFLLAITELKDRLFMPFQVGHEYHSNRHSVIETLTNSHNHLLSSIIEIFEKNITNLLNQYLRHPSIQIETFKKLHDDFLKKVEEELDNQKKNHPDFKGKDETLIQLTELYENKVGVQFTKDELKRIYAEGKERYDQKIPPGYKDLETKRKKDEQHIYGDLIIWKEVISLAKKEKKEIVFITDDRKEDWWTIENGKTIRPREELVKEFYDLTGLRILIYNADNFLHYAKKRQLATLIKDETINEVKKLRQSDENFISAIDLLKNAEVINSSIKWNTSLIFELLNNFENVKASNIWLNTSGSIADILKNSEAMKTNYHWSIPTDSMAELFKNANTKIDSHQWFSKSNSIADLNKNLESSGSTKEKYDDVLPKDSSESKSFTNNE